jgi:hypothetical protein
MRLTPAPNIKQNLEGRLGFQTSEGGSHIGRIARLSYVFIVAPFPLKTDRQ